MLLVGIDSIEIKRIENSVKKDSFVERVYSHLEQNELGKKNGRFESAAAMFAAKEAFFKAIGVGIFKYPLTSVSLLHRSSGEPYLKLSGDVKMHKKVKDYEFAVSITHTKEIATAIVVGEHHCSPD